MPHPSRDKSSTHQTKANRMRARPKGQKPSSTLQTKSFTCARFLPSGDNPSTFPDQAKLHTRSPNRSAENPGNKRKQKLLNSDHALLTNRRTPFFFGNHPICNRAKVGEKRRKTRVDTKELSYTRVSYRRYAPRKNSNRKTPNNQRCCKKNATKK